MSRTSVPRGRAPAHAFAFALLAVLACSRPVSAQTPQTQPARGEPPQEAVETLDALHVTAQRPPTAKGMGFVVLEDETGRVQMALPPKLAEALRPALAESRILAVAGRVERASGHVTLLAEKLRAYTQPGTQPGAEQTDEQADPGRRRKDAPGARLAHG